MTKILKKVTFLIKYTKKIILISIPKNKLLKLFLIVGLLDFELLDCWIVGLLLIVRLLI
jgi:hypothetical protein